MVGKKGEIGIGKAERRKVENSPKSPTQPSHPDVSRNLNRSLLPDLNVKIFEFFQPSRLKMWPAAAGHTHSGGRERLIFAFCVCFV